MSDIYIMVKHTDLERKKVLIESKISQIETKKKRAIIEHTIIMEKLQSKLDKFNKELKEIDDDTIEEFICCGMTFKSKKELEKHKLTETHRRNHEPWIFCKVCRKFFFGVSKRDYDKLPTVDKMKTEYYKHLNDCIYCPYCDEEFANHVTKARHVCNPIDDIPDELPRPEFYDTYNEEVEIDENFDYFLLEDLSQKQSLQLEAKMEKTMVDDALYFIKEQCVGGEGRKYQILRYEDEHDTDGELSFQFDIPKYDETDMDLSFGLNKKKIKFKVGK